MLKGYIRHSVHTDVENILKKIKDVIEQKGDTLKLNDVDVHINRKKLKVYAEKGCVCRCCGKEAKYVAVEKSKLNGNRWILHLYINEDENIERLLTRDHIYPLSKGGHGEVENLQPMCAVCNAKKSDNMLTFASCQ